jgi:XamI restriction endonuclease
MPNASKHPSKWTPDIAKSVKQYNDWYHRESPKLYAAARGKAVDFAARAMEVTRDFRELTPKSLREQPDILIVARYAVSPPPARERVAGFASVSKGLVDRMEQANALPLRSSTLDDDLMRLCNFLSPLLDPGIFVWVRKKRKPTAAERDKALLLLGDRLAQALYAPVVRNAQEARQKKLMRTFLKSRGYSEQTTGPTASFPSKSFGMGRNVIGQREDKEPQNMPIDCVIRPASGPLLCVEMKSAGDFTNVNKRRKEESDKHASLQREHGKKVRLLLQLFGYFNQTYLSFEASAGIDWAWDHRLKDFAPYL